jgi:hypothetical protein
MTPTMTEGAAYRMPSGRRARYHRYVASQEAYQFVYEDDGTELRHRQFLLTKGNLRLAVPEVSQ